MNPICLKAPHIKRENFINISLFSQNHRFLREHTDVLKYVLKDVMEAFEWRL
ncbi:MAG: hypothetical protein Q8M34_11190 [Thermodesulfovibrionales bacterium]|nr:hypothetical protein [Thermodesulfovibrionales bacterium]